MPNIIDVEKVTLRIIISRKAIRITSVLENAIPVAKFLCAKTFIRTYVNKTWKIDPNKHKNKEYKERSGILFPGMLIQISQIREVKGRA